MATSTTPPQPVPQGQPRTGSKPYNENGRRYLGEKYMYPYDEEEMDCMDIYHKLFLVARRDQLHSQAFVPNLQEAPRILDLGTGTGIWAIDMGDKYPFAEVVGIDSASIQPSAVPMNVSFIQEDFETSGFEMGLESWDLIHMRMLNGSVCNWPKLYHNVFRHLKPGGLIEHVEFDIAPGCDDDTLPLNSPLIDWTRNVLEATEQSSWPLAYNKKTRVMLETEGFEDIQEQVIQVPLNPWPKDPHMKDIGRWCSLAFTQRLQAMSLAPLMRIKGWQKEEVDKVVAEITKIICSKRFHVYHRMHIWTARRPYGKSHGTQLTESSSRADVEIQKRNWSLNEVQWTVYQSESNAEEDLTKEFKTQRKEVITEVHGEHTLRRSQSHDTLVGTEEDQDTDAASDMISDVNSILSFAVSLNSSRTSNNDEMSRLAADEFIDLLFADDILKSIFDTETKKDKIGADRFERNLRRLLIRLSVDLGKEARGGDQNDAVRLVRTRSRYIANGVRQKIGPSEQEVEWDRLKKQRGKDIDGLRKVEEFLEKSHPSNSLGKQEESSESEDGNYDSDDLEPQDNDAFPELSKIREFMVSSRAFATFRQHLQGFVTPSFEAKLSRLIERCSKTGNPGEESLSRIPPSSLPGLKRLGAEWQFIAPSQFKIEYNNDKSLSNRSKCFAEMITGNSWDWWPLVPPKREFLNEKARVCWSCSCGEDRWEEVPRYFAKRLARILEQVPDSISTLSPQSSQAASGVVSIPLRANLGSGSSSTAPSSNIRITSSSPSAAQSSQQTTLRAPHVSALATQTVRKDAKYVLLGVMRSDDLTLAQIAAQDYTDDQFFQELRERYNRLRGFLRRWFSIWGYSHCDFHEFEKIDDGAFVPLRPGVPDPGNQLYEYQPKPVEHMPPISEHEFRRRFYSCQKRCTTMSMKILCYLNIHKCRRPCRHTKEALMRIPKKIWMLEEGGDKREIFWGLHGRERISFIMVMAYHFLILLPAFIFWFLWLFSWKHSGDLQNASVPFFTALGLISIFWFPLIKR